MEREMSEIRAALLYPGQVRALWVDIATGLREVPEFDDLWTTDWVLSRIETGELQLWAFGEDEDTTPRLCVISRVTEYPKKKVVEILWAFGRDFRRYIDVGTWLIEQFADMVKAEEIRFQGRVGWKRMLKGQGFQLTGALYGRAVGARELH